MAVRLTQGPPAKGEDFYDREEIIRDIWDVLESSSILLAAPRRFGKTSVMVHLRDNPRNGFCPFFFDIEHVESPEEFILELIEEVQKNDPVWSRIKSRIPRLLKAAGSRIEEVEISEFRMKLREAKDVDWKTLGKELLKLIASSEKNLLFILDEFPEMIKLMIERDNEQKTDETKIFLGWLRNIRQTMPDDVKLRFVIDGSICLENLLRQINCISKINDIVKIKVGAFSEEDSLGFIQQLFDSENTKTDENVNRSILEVIGTPIPFFIQIMVSTTIRESRNLQRKITPKFVEEVYQRYLLGTDYKSYFEHYHLRLGEYYTNIGGEKDILKTAKAILSELSIRDGVSKDDLYQLFLEEIGQPGDEEGFGELMSLLEDEFYLEYLHGNDTYRFYSKLLKDWWYRHFGMLKSARSETGEQE